MKTKETCCSLAAQKAAAQKVAALSSAIAISTTLSENAEISMSGVEVVEDRSDMSPVPTTEVESLGDPEMGIVRKSSEEDEEVLWLKPMIESAVHNDSGKDSSLGG